jgi:hypothetical protein
MEDAETQTHPLLLRLYKEKFLSHARFPGYRQCVYPHSGISEDSGFESRAGLMLDATCWPNGKASDYGCTFFYFYLPYPTSAGVTFLFLSPLSR